MIMRLILEFCSMMLEILSFLNWARNMQVSCILILRDEGMFMRREHVMVKATIHSVIISGSQESVLKGVVPR
jgi:hypothetical protein